ncbi:hypothetical protein BC941DRAFT_422927 [Chlamydoabsidia padenii]|nr:hypothetical protein BC941DRAFT_422927 [Chlamydoabsidia padenii]
MDEHKGQVWQKGTLTSSSIDSTTGQRMWRVYDDKCNYHMVGENQVVPLVYLDSNDNTSLNESTAIHSGANDNIVDQPYEETSAIDINKSWGAWQSHTKGFGEKMMKKMGYIKGEGLGIGGQGRLDPVQAYQMGTHYSQDNRPGLGSLTKKKKTKATKTKATTKAGTSSMFDMMNSMFETDDFIEDDHEKVPLQQQQHKDRGGLGTIPKQQNQQQLWQLQEKMNRLIKEQQHGLAAVQRNKGTTMEREFQINLQNTTKQLNSIKKELTKVESRLTRAKNMENMINF